ncbi:MAG: response regulator [Sarcina sp.]
MKKVLIVEDDPMVALINRRYLENMKEINILGPVTREEEIIFLLENEKIDLILLDVYLPEKNGIEILKSLREKNYLVNVIMITAANKIEELKTAFAYGIIDYLVKPFEFHRFSEAINKYKMKESLFNREGLLEQKDIDKLYKKEEEKSNLPKGLNERTLEKILEFLKDNSYKVWTLRDIAYEMKISNVTIKKYMDYLESINKVNVTATSGNVGRPELRYTLA